jgi:hypothetical protein
MSKRFEIEVTDDTTADDILQALYDHSIIRISDPREIQEYVGRSDGTPRMTVKQRDKLWQLCGGYNVPFREDDYTTPRTQGGGFGGPKGMVEGWVGGKGAGTIYVGVEENGRSHS